MGQWSDWSICTEPGEQTRVRNCSIANTCKGQTIERTTCVPTTTSLTTLITNRPPPPPPTLPPVPPTVPPVNPENPCQAHTYVDGCGQYCQNYQQHGYNSYAECIKNGKNYGSNNNLQQSVGCTSFSQLGYHTYADCLRSRYGNTPKRI